MEFNKDEAILAKAMAEIKIQEGDYAEAKVLAMKAQNLDPRLKGISQMLTVLEVYLRAAEKMMNGDIDWYRVLDIHYLADHDTIKRQYKKLSLLLHPDKNTSAGATGAFQLIFEAYELLKDEKRREAYDQKTRWMGISLRSFPSQNGGPSTSVPPRPSTSASVPRPNEQEVPSATHRGSRPVHASGSSAASTSFSGFQSVPTMPSEQKAPPETRKRSQPPSKSENRRSKVPPTTDPTTFWTICNYCLAWFEYKNMYRLRMLRCQECNAAFLAIQIHKPKFSGAGPVPWKQKSERANQNEADANPSGSVNTNKREETGSDVPPEHGNLKRSHEEEGAQGSGGGEGSSEEEQT